LLFYFFFAQALNERRHAGYEKHGARNKPELISVLERNGPLPLEKLNIEQLKDIAHLQGLKGWSKLNKASLVNAIRSGSSPSSSLSTYVRSGVPAIPGYKPYRPPKARGSLFYEYDTSSGHLDMIKREKRGRFAGGLVHTEHYEDPVLNLAQTTITHIGPSGIQQANNNEAGMCAFISSNVVGIKKQTDSSHVNLRSTETTDIQPAAGWFCSSVRQISECW